MPPKQPNIIFVFGDQWRAQAFGYAGNPDVKTPNIDALAGQSLNFTNAVSGCPVCSPYRASLLTGQYPLTHGVFVNDVPLNPNSTSIADTFKAGGYDTAYIGKWHVGGQGRSSYIPPERQQGFDFWEVLECTHDYNNSLYYAGSSDEKKYWQGYDAIDQTKHAQEYIKNHNSDKPFLMMLSWGPPHAPYETAPEKYRKMYDPASITLRPNVPADMVDQARHWLAGYYAHCTALDDCMANLLQTIAQAGIEEDTILIFTSDHGDMLGSHGQVKKQRPWEESIRVPFLLRWPGLLNNKPAETTAPIDGPDIMPTLLGLCDIPIPDSVQGTDFSAHIKGEPDPTNGTAMLQCPQPFGQWNRRDYPLSREYRGLRTTRYTYVRDLNGPWLLYDNQQDPYQLSNRVNDPALADVQAELEQTLGQMLKNRGDEFLPGIEYIKKWNYQVDETGTVPYTN